LNHVIVARYRQARKEIIYRPCDAEILKAFHGNKMTTDSRKTLQFAKHRRHISKLSKDLTIPCDAVLGLEPSCSRPYCTRLHVKVPVKQTKRVDR
jgi:hypothetical protein